MKIAMIGQKGIPATWGGVERHVEELGKRLAAFGHEVVVFTRPSYSDPALHEHLGMRLVSLPTIASKHLDAFVHSFLCSLAVFFGGYDIVHYHGIGPSLLTPLARLRGRKVIATIHAQDWRRAKWGAGASLILRAGEWMALHVPNETICVSRTLADEYRAAGHAVRYIPNGVTVLDEEDPSILSDLGLNGQPYILFVGRLVPEKGVHDLIAAWEALGSPLKLVVAGDTSFTNDYVHNLRTHKDVIFPGYVFGPRLTALFRHAALFALPSTLEGLPIALMEALVYKTPAIASDIIPNIEVLGDAGRYFRAGDAQDLKNVLAKAIEELDELKAEAVKEGPEIALHHDWDRIASCTEDLFFRVLDPSGGRPDMGPRQWDEQAGNIDGDEAEGAEDALPPVETRC